MGDKSAYEDAREFKDHWVQQLIDKLKNSKSNKSTTDIKGLNMAFSNFKIIGEVLKEYQVTYNKANFVEQTLFNVPDYFREDLNEVMQDGVFSNSEFAICENLIYPVLKEVWKKYKTKFTIWSHQSFNYDERLSGFPEYIIAKRSPLGQIVFDKPYFILVEAKQDNFEAGWAQCLAEMIAAQILNAEYPIPIFGITSNGETWQFGKLEGNNFIRNIVPYSIYELDKLFTVVNFIFQECEKQLHNLVAV